MASKFEAQKLWWYYYLMLHKKNFIGSLFIMLVAGSRLLPLSLTEVRKPNTGFVAHALQSFIHASAHLHTHWHPRPETGSTSLITHILQIKRERLGDKKVTQRQMRARTQTQDLPPKPDLWLPGAAPKSNLQFPRVWLIVSGVLNFNSNHSPSKVSDLVRAKENTKWWEQSYLVKWNPFH